MGVQVFLCLMDGRKIVIQLCDTEKQLKSITVLQLKEKIDKDYYRGTPEERARLIYEGRELSEGRPLSDYGIQNCSTIRMVLCLRGGGETPGKGDDGMGDKEGKNRSMETLTNF